MNLWSQIVAFFQNNPILGMITTIATLFSAIYAFYSRYKDRPRVELSIFLEGCILFDQQAPGLEEFALYDINSGLSIKKLNEVAVQIQNTGTKRIDREDINASMPIQVSIVSKETNDEYNILDYKIINASIQKRRNINIQNTGKDLVLDFDYLEPGEDILIYFRYYGIEAGITYEGEIKSGKLKRTKHISNKDKYNNIDNHFVSFLIKLEDIDKKVNARIFYIILGCLIVSFIIALVYNALFPFITCYFAAIVGCMAGVAILVISMACLQSYINKSHMFIHKRKN